MTDKVIDTMVEIKELAMKVAEQQFDELLAQAGMTEEELAFPTLKDKCVGVAVISHIVEEPELKKIAMELYKAV